MVTKSARCLFMSKLIPLTQGKYAIVDDENYEWLSQYKWHTHKSRNTFYARRQKQIKGKQIKIPMHREILGLKPKDKRKTDHKNHDGLDNRINNIRICTNAQNIRNQMIRKNCSSKYRGVYWAKNCKKWAVSIKVNYKKIHLGCFNSEIDAAKAYDNAAKIYFGEFAVLNFVNE
jgi:hypothetical protein